MPGEPHPDLLDDEQLTEALGRVLDEDDAVPAELVAFATASLTWRTVGEELAELVDLLYDSARDETVAVRDARPDSARMLSFGDGERGVELELDGGRILGVVRPGGRYRVEVQGPEARSSAETDSDTGTGTRTDTETDTTGMFELDAPTRGPLRVAVSALQPGAFPALVTAWFDVG